MQGILWLITFILVFSWSSQVLLPNHIKSPNFNEKIGTPRSKSPPASGCGTPHQAHTRPSCKSKPSKGSGG
ncbi:hypothetical protein N665_0913s0007 [Sinapis alba]|nr:hypothetical protein N665_0913s0007 [Sinapis alba]